AETSLFHHFPPTIPENKPQSQANQAWTERPSLLFLLPAHEATIYQQIHARTEPRCLARQKDRRADHLVDARDLPKRCIGRKCFELPGHFRTLVHRREGVPRTDRIHPNPTVTPFHRQTF